MTALYGLDAYAPAEIARRVEAIGVTKARLATLPLVLLAVLAGGFIGLGALFFVVVTADSGLHPGPTRLLGGLSFSLGLVLVILAGAELFTGNNLLIIAWVSRHITGREVLRNWGWVLLGNALGALGLVALVLLGDLGSLQAGAVGAEVQRIAAAKLALPPLVLVARGIGCNILVCLAVWMAMGGRSVSDKIAAILLPITAFVAIGFEHSIANLFLLPWGLALMPDSNWGAMGPHLAWVILGNVLGGSGMVGLVYWGIYLATPSPEPEV